MGVVLRVSGGEAADEDVGRGGSEDVPPEVEGGGVSSAGEPGERGVAEEPGVAAMSGEWGVLPVAREVEGVVGDGGVTGMGRKQDDGEDVTIVTGPIFETGGKEGEGEGEEEGEDQQAFPFSTISCDTSMLAFPVPTSSWTTSGCGDSSPTPCTVSISWSSTLHTFSKNEVLSSDHTPSPSAGTMFFIAQWIA